MCADWLVDAVTLQHFGSVEQLSVLESFLSEQAGPIWSATVRSEVLAGIGLAHCDAVLAAAWLGAPAEVEPVEMSEIFKIQIALGGGGDSGLEHLGEAESIYLADKIHAGIITDDNNAHHFVARRLGPNRVLDTIGVLRACVQAHALTAHEAKLLADAMMSAGRHFLASRPRTLVVSDFT